MNKRAQQRATSLQFVQSLIQIAWQIALETGSLAGNQRIGIEIIALLQGSRHQTAPSATPHTGVCRLPLMAL
jgi:hypothetical protein